MTDADQPQFLALLGELETFFREALTVQQREQYWRLCQDRATLPEWAYAAREAMVHEGYYHVPLIAHLMDYVREYRKEVA